MWEIRDFLSLQEQPKCVAHKLEYSGEFMGECYVTVTVESPTPIDWAIGDYLIYRGERFELNYDPTALKQARKRSYNGAFKYESVKFNSLADELTRCNFLDFVMYDNTIHYSWLPKFSFYCEKIQDLADRIQYNLDRCYTSHDGFEVETGEYFDDGEPAYETHLMDRKWTVVVLDNAKKDSDGNLIYLNKSLDVDGLTVWEALALVNSEFGLYFTIRGRVITIGETGLQTEHLFKYGKGQGLQSLERKADSEQQVITRLRAYGSERNLPWRYYNKKTYTDATGREWPVLPDNIAVTHLMFPSFASHIDSNYLDPYIDSDNIDELGIREGTAMFDGTDEDLEEIYPSIERMHISEILLPGTSQTSISGRYYSYVEQENYHYPQLQEGDNGYLDEVLVGYQPDDSRWVDPANSETYDNFVITIKDVGFDINDFLITTETACISFKTGGCAGREFEIRGCKAVDYGYELTLKCVQDDSVNQVYPNKYYPISAGDRFVLLYIDMPETYIAAASVRLLNAAKEYLAKNCYTRYTYTPKVDEIYMARQHDEAMSSSGEIESLHDTIKEGNLMLFSDDDLNIEGNIIISKLTITEGEKAVPVYEVTLREDKEVGTLEKIKNTVSDLSSTVSGTGSGSGGGYSLSQMKSLVKTIGDQYFLSKTIADKAEGLIWFANGLQSGEYISGLSGGKIDATGNAEVESLKVRSYMQVQELVINRLSTLEGDQMLTESDTVDSVVELTQASDSQRTFGLYLLPKYDGYTTAQVAGNILKGMVNSLDEAVSGVSKGEFYTAWFRVNTVNASLNYITVTMYPADECPAGKNFPPVALMKLARWGHQTDSTRQSCIFLSSSEGRIIHLNGVDAPMLSRENYALVLGKHPDFLDTEVYGLDKNQDYLYAKGIIVQDLFRVDVNGQRVPEYVDRGLYDASQAYYCKAVNPESNVYETSDAWHLGCKWRCCKTQGPVAPVAPSWKATEWVQIEGNSAFRVDFEETEQLFDPDNFSTALTVQAFVGNEDVTVYIDDTDVTWTRYSEDAGGSVRLAADNAWALSRASAGKKLSLTIDDLEASSYWPKTVRFTATVTLRDEEGNATATETATLVI